MDYYVTYSTRHGERTVLVDADSASAARKQIEESGGYGGEPLNLRYDLITDVRRRSAYAIRYRSNRPALGFGGVR